MHYDEQEPNSLVMILWAIQRLMQVVQPNIQPGALNVPMQS